MVPSAKYPQSPARWRRAVSLLLLTACLAALREIQAAQPAAGSVNFARQIRPIFSENCFACHGPDEKARKAKLRFDTKEGAFRLRKGKTVIVPGKSAESELVRRIRSKDPEDMMPPPDSHHKLSAAQISLLMRWID